ncbi:MAG: hypothetical protein R3D00_15480 [Bacteroidia bacterium]
MKIFTCILLIFLGINGYAQDYLEKIAAESCECVDKIPDGLDRESFYMEAGFCMIQAAGPYKKKIKSDLDIDLDNIVTDGEKLGKVLGMKMALICPSVIVKMANMDDETEDSEIEPTNQIYSLTGKITSIEDDFFVTFSVKDDAGKTVKFYWITFVESNTELIDSYKDLLEKSVRISYIAQEFFDPRISEYRIFNIISKIEVLD